MRFFQRREFWLTANEKARLQHQRWLNRAVRRDTRGLRIPVRRVDQGGYRHLDAVPGGRQWAERWWMDAIENADLLVDS